MRHRVALAVVVVSLAASWALAQVPVGGEFRIDTYTTDNEWAPVVVSDAAGGFVVVWKTNREGSNFGDIFARRFDATGAPRGDELRANTFPTGIPEGPSVASDAAGDFVVVWPSYWLDGSGLGITGQRFDSSGAPWGFQFQVNTYTTGRQYRTAVSAAAAGDFVVAWTRGSLDAAYNVFGQRYDATGAPQGAEFRVNTFTTQYQNDPALASDAAGDFAVAWTTEREDPFSISDVLVRRFDASGAPFGSEFQVNSYATWQQYDPSVASDPAGNIIVVWTSVGQDLGLTMGVFGQRYDASGMPRGAEFQVNTFTPTDQGPAVVASDAAGNFIVVWRSRDGQDGSFAGVFAQRYESSGVRLGAEFQVNAYTTSHQWYPSVAADSLGNFVVVWKSLGQDGSQGGVFARRFGYLQPASLAVDPSASGGSDGNGVFEPGESVEVKPSFKNVNGLSQTVSFDGVASSFTGPPGEGASYQLQDAAASYGPIANGETAACTDCYRVGVVQGGARPAVHWDATLVEALSLEPPGQVLSRPLHLGESFADVPKTSPYYRFVETLLHKNVTGGCGTGVFCPANAVTREQMAVFVLAGNDGAGYRPPPCTTSGFDDVPASSPFCRWILELVLRGVVSGCGGDNFCPTDPVTREQMSVFLLHTLDPALNPPACTTPVFPDVPASSPFCRWIEELARRGITGGCGGGNYCPADPVTREQMAVFISATFGLSLYGP